MTWILSCILGVLGFLVLDRWHHRRALREAEAWARDRMDWSRVHGISNESKKPGVQPPEAWPEPGKK